MDRQEMMNTMKYYVRLRKELEVEYENFFERHRVMFRRGEILAKNPSESDVRKHKEEMHRLAFLTYKKYLNTQIELLGELERKMHEIINEIDYGLDIESFLSKYKLDN